jgi:hypothetical protein
MSEVRVYNSRPVNPDTALQPCAGVCYPVPNFLLPSFVLSLFTRCDEVVTCFKKKILFLFFSVQFQKNALVFFLSGF